MGEGTKVKFLDKLNMNQALPIVNLERPELEYLFDIKFDGASFDGAMKIGNLALELRSLNFCLNEIISELKVQNRTSISFDDYDIVVEAFQNNCFKKRIKLIIRNIEKHPVITAAVVTIFMGTVAAIPLYRESNNKISPKMMLEIEDKVALKLLDSKDFRKGISDIVAQPLESPSDSSHIMPPLSSNIPEIKIPYKARDNYLEEDKNDNNINKLVDVSEITREDSILGRIIAVDLDATKHQIDFKIYGESKRVNGTLSDGLDINDYKLFLGEFVKIEGLITVIDETVTTMEIKSIIKSEEPGQKTMF